MFPLFKRIRLCVKCLSSNREYSHRADITLIEGQSYRVREGEAETAARRKKKS
jgi:hypothetical protein